MCQLDILSIHEQREQEVANYLSQLFKKEVGIPISDYIQQERIEEAKKLIALSDTPLSDVCSSLTFNDQSYFTKVFKKFTGVTPKQYRNNKHVRKAEEKQE